jgi:hypothetical protein
MGCGCNKNQNNERKSSRMPIRTKSNSPKKDIPHREMLENRAKMLRKNEKMREPTLLSPQKIEELVKKRRRNNKR